ncbi:unnamed protein product, partial [Porites lobata]
ITYYFQLKICTDNNMESWFWILGWILSILTITGNGFIVLLVISQRKLRTKTNAFIVSLAVADFCVGAFAFPSLFFCEIRDGCNWPRPYASWVDFIRWLFAYASIMNLCSLALDRIVLSVCSALLEIIFSCMLIFCFISMVTVVCKQTRSSSILAKQLRFNHGGFKFNAYDKSAVVMLAVVVGFALACCAIYMRCAFDQIWGNQTTHDHLSCKNDFKYKIPMFVLNSAINPLAYALFKRDIKRALKGHKLTSEVAR